MDNTALIMDVANIIRELFNFEGSIEELCAMSEMEGEFEFNSNEMLDKLHQFANLFCT